MPPAHSHDSFPIAVRILFGAIGIGLFYVLVKVGEGLFDTPPDAVGFFRFLLLGFCTAFALSFALPARASHTAMVLLTVLITNATLSMYLWRFGSPWHYAIVVVIALTIYLVVKIAQRRNHPKKSSDNLCHDDENRTSSSDYLCSDSCDGGGGGD